MKSSLDSIITGETHVTFFTPADGYHIQGRQQVSRCSMWF